VERDRIEAYCVTMTRPRQLLQLVHFIRNCSRHPSLRELARRVGRSPYHLQREFQRMVGESPKQYTLRLRLEHAAARLMIGEASVLKVAMASGFTHHEVFTRAFRRRFGVTPGDSATTAHAVRPQYAAPRACSTLDSAMHSRLV
jgi:AraC family transcriptional regulator